jgi:hypothetical protein
MTKRMTMALASCLALAACGGDDAGNAAVGKTFTYGTAQSASYSQTYAVTSQVGSVSALQGVPDTASAQGMASIDEITSSLLGSNGVGATSPAQQQALAAGARAASRQLVVGGASSFDNPSCVTTTATSVAMKGCTITNSAYGETDNVQVDGTFTFDAAKGTLAWDFTVNDNFSYSYSGGTVTGNVHLHESGTLTVTATTIQGQMLAELSASASSGSVSTSMAVSEAVLVDLTYADAAVCSTRVTGGTLEAKRVWTDRGGQSSSQLTDKAAMVTWTGCGQANIVYSWK